MDSLPDWAQAMVRDLRQEAGKHRQEAAAARDELEVLRSEAAERGRRDALGSVEGVLADPDDLGRYVNLDELVDDDGRPDAEAYREAAEGLVKSKPHLGPRRPSGRAGNEHVGGAPLPRGSVEAGREAFIGMVRGDG